MIIGGDARPIANKSYTYTVLFQAFNSKIKSWTAIYNGKSLGNFKTGVFKFDSNLAGKIVKITAIVVANNKEQHISKEVLVLAATPLITDINWFDSNNAIIGNRTVGYLDTVRLVIKTRNIPVNEILKVTIYEDEYADGHDDDSSRNMGTYDAKVNSKGVAEIKFNNIKVYQKILNDKDYVDESVHEFYARIVYDNKINRVEDKIQLNIKNELIQLVKPKPTNKPVVVAASKKENSKTEKSGEKVIFNMFFDGTMNNMTNTTERKNKSSVYYNKSNKEDDSYTNFYSNVALLFMNNDVKNEEDIIKIYTEGIGTADKKQDQAFPGGAMGTGIAIYMRGIRDKVQRGIDQMKEKANEKYFSKGKTIDSVTINVFGFSRGAAAARFFLSQEVLIQFGLKLKDKNKIKFNFIGLFDTVASYGVLHLNDVIELQLNLKGKPQKVVQLAAADEYRSNFKLTDITSSIKAGVGYQLTMPGVHSDIGGGYSETTDEKRYLGEQMVHGKDDSFAMKEFEKIKKQYIKEGWYKENEFIIEKDLKTNFSKLGNLTYSTLYTLYGFRKGIRNTYQFIPLNIMLTLSEKHANIKYDKFYIETPNEKYNVNKELSTIKKQLYNYAISNDGINSLAVTLSHDQLMWVRNRYLHRSNKDDSPLTMGGRYVNGKPERDILEG